MKWSYRLVRHPDGRTIHSDGEHSLAIHEVYFDKTGAITGFTKEPVSLWAATVEHLEITLTRLKEALTKPIIDKKDIPND